MINLPRPTCSCDVYIGLHYFPPPWHNAAYNGATIDGDETTAAMWRPDTAWERVHYPLPEDMDICVESEDSYCSYYMVDGARNDWFSNYTHIPVEQFLPREMYHDAGNMGKGHPWSAPGTARVFGGGCGVPGGNPWGCWYNDQLPYGSCCVVNSNVSH